MLKGIRKRKGSIAVESAIMVPLFLVGILTLGYLIKFTSLEESTLHDFTDEAHRLQAEAGYTQDYVLGFANYGINAKKFKARIKDRVTEDGHGHIEDVSVDHVWYRLPSVGVDVNFSDALDFSEDGEASVNLSNIVKTKLYDNLIGGSVTYHVPLKIPHIFKDEIRGQETVLCRAFVGKNNKGETLSYGQMEQNQESETVWVFPRAGEVYHRKDCSYIENQPTEVLLTKEIKNQYKPCGKCHPEEKKLGSAVYIFTNSGKAYHDGDCYMVKRYVIEMDKQDAINEGYRECSKCGG